MRHRAAAHIIGPVVWRTQPTEPMHGNWWRTATISDWCSTSSVARLASSTMIGWRGSYARNEKSHHPPATADALRGTKVRSGAFSSVSRSA